MPQAKEFRCMQSGTQQTLRQTYLDGARRNVDGQDHIGNRRQQDFLIVVDALRWANDIDVVRSGGENVDHLAEHATVFGLDPQADDVVDPVFALFQLACVRFVHEEPLPAQRFGRCAIVDAIEREQEMTLVGPCLADRDFIQFGAEKALARLWLLCFFPLRYGSSGAGRSPYCSPSFHRVLVVC